jgi:hypothetical protein
MSRTDLSAEWSVLLTACSAIPAEEKAQTLRPLLGESIDWKFLFDLAEKHGALPLLHSALLRVEASVPDDQLRTLRQNQQSNLVKSLLLARELIRILECLSSTGINAMPYKGAALAELLYGDIGLRQSGDIDLLIHPQDFVRARDAVRELGFVPHLNLSEAEERAYLKSGYECAFDGPGGKNLLEIQWAIQPRFYAIDFDLDKIFERAFTVSVAGQPMKTPRPEDLVLVLSAHAAKHVWGRLVWISDLAQLMVRPNLDWDGVLSQANELGIVRMVRVSMVLAHRLLGAPMPPCAKQSLSENAAAPELAAAVERELLSGSEPDVESFSYFRRMMRMRERRLDRLRFAQRLMFTPGPSEWNAIRLPAPLFPLYRVIRLSRLVAKLLSSQKARSGGRMQPTA